MWRLSRSSILLVILAAAFSVMPLSHAGPAPRRGGVLTIAQPGDPANFNSQGDPLTVGITAISNVQEPLVYMDPTSRKFLPGLAKSWTVSPDGKEYVFTLWDGVKFSDGTPFTADDVVFTFEMLTGKRPGSIYVGLFGAYLESVSAPAPNRVIMKMKNPSADWLQTLAEHWAARILSKNAVEQAGKDYGTATAIGTGPFVIKEWIKGDHITLARNPAYWGKPPYLDEVILRRVVDGTARMIQLKSGQADVVFEPLLDQIDQVVNDPNLQVFIGKATAIVWLRFNTSAEPFNNLKARQAVFHAIDADKLRSALFASKYGSTATDFFPNWHAAYDPQFAGLRQDLNKARAALREGGFTAESPLRFSLSLSNMPEWIQLATLIQAQLRPLGIQVEILPLEAVTFNAFAARGQYQAAVSRYGYPLGVADDYMFKQYGAEGNDNRTWLNRPGGLQVPEIERLMLEARYSPDGGKAKTLYRQIANLLVANAITHPIAFRNNVDIATKRIHNMIPKGAIELLRGVWKE